MMKTKNFNRRSFIKTVSISGVGAFLAGTTPSQISACSHSSANAQSSLLDFQSIPASMADTVVVADGYKTETLISWGDPILPGAPSFDPTGKGDAQAQTLQFGDNNDGMSCFPLSNDRALMVVNNEYCNHEYLFEHDGKNLTAGDVAKSQAATGLSLFEIVRKDNSWVVDKNGQLNRRVTANSKTQMSGPAKGHNLLKTDADPQGQWILGTINNCANGETPWGTYLTCEENFNKYFGTEEKYKLSLEEKRYGIKDELSKFKWENHDARFDIKKNPNESHRFGWIVEVDPFDPKSIPIKRSALGRFKHENAALTINQDGHVVVYMGDDEKGEHIYRFVSKNKYQPGNKQHNKSLLDEGTLYVARFEGEFNNLKGQGKWIELTHGKNGLTVANGFADQGEVLIYARKAATVVGATTMDRPEWIVMHPTDGDVYCTLTNNKERGVKVGQPLNGPNPRSKNYFGQIIRWKPGFGDHTSDEFDWEIFILAGNPSVYENDARAGDSTININNMFNSPDGLGFDQAGRLWIMSDGKYSNKKQYKGMGNNQMLCADPNTGELRRFMTGPIASEITGICFSPDQKTMFVGIQHPGEKNEPSHFPDGGKSKPRSSIVMITRENGKSFSV